MIKQIELNDNHSEKITYTYPDYPAYINRSFLSRHPDYAAPNHWHDDIEFIYIISGHMDYNVNGQIVHLCAGEGLIVTSGQMHYGFSRTKKECDFICILLHPLLLCPVHSFEKDFVSPAFYDSQLPYLQLYPEIPWHKQILDTIRSFHEVRSSGSAPIRLLSGFALICALLCENISHDSEQIPASNPNLAVIKDMVSFIQKSYTQKVSLEDIARAGAVGQSKCCKLFRQYFSCSPVAYLNQYRLRKSVDLLRDTGLSITEISLTVGFHSPSYYTETFRRWTGKSPREYRREMKK